MNEVSIEMEELPSLAGKLIRLADLVAGAVQRFTESFLKHSPRRRNEIGPNLPALFEGPARWSGVDMGRFPLCNRCAPIAALTVCRTCIA